MMRYKLLGRSGLRVSELCLGTMTFGEEWGWGSSHKESRKVFDRFLAAGGNFLDTANKYTNGTSEKLLGEFMAGIRKELVLATKFTLNMNENDPNAHGNHRKNMVQSLEDSLSRLNTDYIDLYWLHAWDFMTPVEEVLRALDDMVRSGKILYIGISDTPAWIVSRANTIAEFRGWTPFTGLQIEYSLIERTVERELVPMATELDMAILAWSPLGSGLLSGKYKGEKQKSSARLAKDSMRFTDRNQKIVDKVVDIANKKNVSAAQVSLNWLRQSHSQVIPIIGARNVSQLDDNLNCLNFKLTDDEMKELKDVSQIEPGFPHDFLGRDRIQNIIYGSFKSKIDNHRR